MNNKREENEPATAVVGKAVEAETTAGESGHKARVLVVDDHAVVREGWACLIRRQPDLVHCGEASSVAETYKAVEALRPDLVLLDLWLGDGDGLELIKSLKSQFPKLRILVISFCDEAIYAERALRAGARGYLMKSQSFEEVVTAIRTVLADELYLSSMIAHSMLNKSFGFSRTRQNDVASSLTDRELQVLHLLGAGQSTRKIADELKLSFKTIEAHRENIKRKLGLQNAVELIRYATTWTQERQRPRLLPDDLLPAVASQN